jgi:sugar phosphate isomerase/epimerase
MWMWGRFERPRDFFCTAVEMGFRRFELTSAAGAAFYDDIHPGEFDIRSLHDPAPGDLDLRTLWQNDISFTSLDEERRLLAVSTARRSIDVAVRYGAQAVVLHLGQREADPSYQKHLERLASEGLVDSPEANGIRILMATQRAVHGDERMAALLHSLDDLVPYAAVRGVCLGLENRRSIHEIPNFDEMRQIMERYPDVTVGYWHDTGHAEAQARAGMTPHAEWLRCFAPRLIGLHLHDVCDFSDHRSPGSGCIDWQGLAALAPEYGLRTAEIKESVPPDAVWMGVDYLIATGWVRA